MSRKANNFVQNISQLLHFWCKKKQTNKHPVCVCAR